MSRAWKAVVAGVCWLGFSVAMVWSERRHGASVVQQWEAALVFAAATAGIVVWILKRR